ncbi:MAG TPA: glutathione S-transferase family protein [Solirubrobacterales bacterium]
MQARLYSIPGSHPSFAARLMLERKGIPFKRTDLMPVVSKGVVRAAGFPGNTVPAVKIDGKRTQGSRQIARELDLIQPDPPLFPADPEKRAAVEEAERFGDEDLQHPVRQLIWWALRRDMSPLVGFSEGAKLGIPINSVTVKSSAPLVVLAARINGSTDVAVRRALAELPGLLDTVDAAIAAGTIDGEELNAADFQIAPTVRLAMTMVDLRPAIEARPAGRHAKRVVPHFPGDIPPILPGEWLAPLQGAGATA